MMIVRFVLLSLILSAGVAHAEPWQGPIFDAHLHYNDDAVERYSIGSLYELFSRNGVKAILANSRPNDGTRALVEASLRGVRNDLKVVPFIRVYRNRADYGTWFANSDIYRMIVDEEKRGYYRGVGEFHLYGKDAGSKIVKDIVDFAVEKNFILHAHCDEEALEMLFAHNPKAGIIWAHTGFDTPLSRVSELLVKYPRLWGELSYRSGIAGPHDLPDGWKEMFARFPDRFLIGSDTWIIERWQSYPRIMSQYRHWLGQLPPDIAARIAWKNGAALFGIE